MPNLTQTGFSNLGTILGTFNLSVGGLATVGTGSADILTANNNTISIDGVTQVVTAGTIDVSGAKGSTGLATYSPTALATAYTRIYTVGHDGTN